MNDKVKILNIPLYTESISKCVSHIVDVCISDQPKESHLISATGAHGIITTKKDNKFRQILNSFYINLPDGMPGIWIGRLKGHQEMERCYGPDFFKECILKTSQKDIKHYFLGGKNGVAQELKNVCENEFGNTRIVGSYSPPFREMTEEELKDIAIRINDLETDIVWIGLSTPKQEKFAYRLSMFTKVHFICTIGAAFDFHTGSVKQAPKWIQQNGLEWFFRLLTEPKRLWKRYLEIVPLFIIYNLVEFFKGDFFDKIKEEH